MCLIFGRLWCWVLGTSLFSVTAASYGTSKLHSSYLWLLSQGICQKNSLGELHRALECSSMFGSFQTDGMWDSAVPPSPWRNGLLTHGMHWKARPNLSTVFGQPGAYSKHVPRPGAPKLEYASESPERLDKKQSSGSESLRKAQNCVRPTQPVLVDAGTAG